jgi:Kef-type K+ transport system membrane component KefB
VFKGFKIGKTTLFYLVFFMVFGLSFWAIFQEGKVLEAERGGEPLIMATSQEMSALSIFWQELSHHIQLPLSILLLQVIVIVIVARGLGALFQKLGQPAVVGEILAGILLGPTLLGQISPESAQFLFTQTSLGAMSGLSQIGLLFFMFIIGMELDLDMLRQKAKQALILSSASIVFPYFLGVVLAYFLYKTFAPPEVSFLAYGLFMGIAMSITAFPVLARIVQERGLGKHPTGILALTTAATGDVAAWCLLAVVVAVVQAGTVTSALWTVFFAILYVLVATLLVRPLFKKVGEVYVTRENINRSLVAAAFLTLLISAWGTEAIGIHALFGAFMAGVMMPPKVEFRRILTEKIEDITLIVLLPLFFVQTGLKTDFRIIFQADMIVVTLVICAVAVIGKFVGTALAAKYLGENWKESLTLGALMNTRGLMELVVLDLGYQMGILDIQVFSALVFMALATTIMTGPAVTLIDKWFSHRVKIFPTAERRILLAFGPAQMGRRLMNLAALMAPVNTTKMGVKALHYTPDSDINTLDAEHYENKAFAPLKNVAQIQNIPVETMYKATEDITDEIVGESKKAQWDLLLIGQAKSVFSSQAAGGKVREIIKNSSCPVGIFLNKRMGHLQNLCVFLEKDSNDLPLKIMEWMLLRTECKVTIITPTLGGDRFSPATFASHPYLERIQFENHSWASACLRSADLILMDLNLWEIEVESQIEKKLHLLRELPSVLLLNQPTLGPV